MSVSRYWLLVIGLAVLVPTTYAVVDATIGSDPEETFCTAEGLLGPNGETYGRSTSRECQFVDGDGELVRHTRDGQPLCYGGYEGMGIVPCDEPGVQRPK